MKFIISILIIININFANANSIGQSTGFKLPRFASTKSDESNLRVGPSIDYPIKLTYIIQNTPLEIIDEHETWRKIIDTDGNQGWLHKSLLKGNRYGIIKTEHREPSQIFSKPEGAIIWKIGNRNIVKINKCLKSWCHINFNEKKGWINKINIWGVYKEEEFNMPFFQFLINFYWKLV